MRRNSEYVAVLASDFHFTLTPPVARSAEPNWLSTQAGYLGQLAGLAVGYGRTDLGHGFSPLPIIGAGDFFDRWNAPAELINFLIAYMPTMYGIPGQHDLPYHSYADIKKSAYWTLVEAGKIKHLEPGKPVSIGPLRLWGFPWGFPVEPCREPHGIALDVAVIHSYIWTQKTRYPGAPEEKQIKAYVKQLQGFHAAVFGDNHSGFLSRVGGHNPIWECNVINCGGFIRRKSDERNYQPTVGLLRQDGTITRYKLDVSADQFLDESEIPASLTHNSLGLETFIEELSTLGDAAIDFTDAIRRLLEQEKVSSIVKQVVLKSLEGVKQ